MINATQLLIRIYEKEDHRFGVKYNDGIIGNSERPLDPRSLKIKDGVLGQAPHFKDVNNQIVTAFSSNVNQN